MLPAVHPPATPPISAVIITLNAARLLSTVLDAVAWCDEIVVVDSGSTDATLDIAQRHGCRVLHHDFDGFGPQKRYAVEAARNDWVLVVDADEVLTAQLRDEIQREVGRADAGVTAYRGFELPISLVFLGRLMRHGGEYKKPHLRLFDRRHGNYNDARVHEDVVLNGPVSRLRNHIVHDSYGSLDEYVDKLNRYTTAASRDLAARGRTASVADVVLRFPLAFIKEYVLKRSFLDGYPGFMWSLLSGVYPAVKYAKLRERAQARPSPDTE